MDKISLRDYIIFAILALITLIASGFFIYRAVNFDHYYNDKSGLIEATD